VTLEDGLLAGWSLLSFTTNTEPLIYTNDPTFQFGYIAAVVLQKKP
jgi:hypothetical protein